LTKIKVERLRKGGPGGQNRNKRETAIRMTDERTGVSVTGVRERSQHQNLEIAKELLEERLRRLRHKPKRRKPTKPTKGSKQRRMDAKRHAGAKKKDRSRGGWD
jgi:ribosome-associated protein